LTARKPSTSHSRAVRNWGHRYDTRAARLLDSIECSLIAPGGDDARRSHGDSQQNRRRSIGTRCAGSERFRQHVGMPPLEYLTRWRMTLARHALRSHDATLATIATMVGYESETAFSLAFKRLFGESPGRNRTRAASASAPGDAVLIADGTTAFDVV